jgi:hypothetical protein
VEREIGQGEKATGGSKIARIQVSPDRSARSIGESVEGARRALTLRARRRLNRYETSVDRRSDDDDNDNDEDDDDDLVTALLRVARHDEC